jgi:DNA damage-binding protein 1
MIGELTPSAAKTMDDLQRNMARLMKGPGIEWKDWRRGGSELIKRETAGFVDGDL